MILGAAVAASEAQAEAQWAPRVFPVRSRKSGEMKLAGNLTNTIIYIVGLIVVIGFILSFFGLR